LKEELIATGDAVIFHQDGNPFWAEWNGRCMARIRDEVMPDGMHPPAASGGEVSADKSDRCQ